MSQQVQKRFLKGEAEEIRGRAHSRRRWPACPSCLSATPTLSPSVLLITFFFRACCILSNFHSSRFLLDGLSWLSVEQYYQYMKAQCFGDRIAMSRIRESRSPTEMKKYGRAVVGFSADKWALVCDGIMEKGAAQNTTKTSA
jgi:hypothetical protein